MADKKKYAPRHTTPIGTLRYPHLNKADAKFNAEKPRFKAPLILTSAEAQPIIDRILNDAEFGLPAAEALRDAAALASRKAGKKIADAKKPENAALNVAYSTMTDPDTGEDTDNVVVTIAGNDRYKKADGTVVMLFPKFFDAKGVEVPFKKAPALWSGSKVRVSYSHFPYYNSATNEYGVSLRLEGVKIIKPVSGGAGGGAESHGFGGAEDGYEADDMGTDESDESTTDDGASPSDGPGDADF